MRSTVQKDKYATMLHCIDLGWFIQCHDDFSFDHADVKYTVYQSDKDKADMGDMDYDDFDDKYPEEVSPEEVSTYYVTDQVAPEYIRRFEDGIPTDNVVKFIIHVLNNALTNQKNSYKAWVKEHPVGELQKSMDGDDEETVIENEMQIENTDNSTFSNSEVIKAKRNLIYCLYRMNQMSRSCGVNMLSVILAQRRARPYLSKSTRNDKPQTLLNNGPIYRADQQGDCTTEITRANDTSFTKARRIFYTDGGEFVNDYRKLDESLTKLEIDIWNEDPRLYTSKFIRSISSKMLVDNYTYVSRPNGGYDKRILEGLSTMSLDMAENNSVVEEVDTLAIALDVIRDSEHTPSKIYKIFTRRVTVNGASTCVEAIPLLNPIYDSDLNIVSQVVSNQIGDGDLSNEGFILDLSNDYFKVQCPKLINSARWGNISTGNFWIHYSGYVVFEPVDSRLVLLAKLSDVLRILASEDWTNLAVIALGENADMVT